MNEMSNMLHITPSAIVNSFGECGSLNERNNTTNMLTISGIIYLSLTLLEFAITIRHDLLTLWPWTRANIRTHVDLPNPAIRIHFRSWLCNCHE